MARNYIELPSSGVVDMMEDIPVSLNFSIADVRDPQSRDTSYSKTITLPGTKNNNKLFSHIFNIGVSGGFNPKIKTKAILYQDTIPVMNGYLQLTNVTITDQNEIEYECVIFGKLANIYTVWADDELTAIDFSDLSHTYSYANIVASWSYPYGQRYVYPMIDYGATDGTYYNVENFLPALYLREYIDRIFRYAGFTYTSNFLTSSFFNHLVIPFYGTQLELTSDLIKNRTFIAQNNSNLSWAGNSVAYTGYSQVPFNTLATSPTPPSDYNTGTYTWTCPATGGYNLSCTMILEIDATQAGAQTFVGGYNFSNIAYVFLVNGVQSYWGGDVAVVPTGNYTAGQTRTGTNTVTFGYYKELTAGDTVTVYAEARFVINSILDNFLSPWVFTSRIKAGSSFTNSPVAKIVEGGSLDFNTTIPNKVKIADLFTSVIKMFNLYVEDNKEKPNDLIIEPRNNFYTSGTTYDWTSKLDISTPIDIKPMGVLDAKDYYYSYKEDKDYWNDLYKRSYGKVYGERLISTDNDFLKDKKETILIFSPTPLVNMPVSAVSTRVIPQIVTADTKGNISAKAANIRMLYYGGVRTSNSKWTFKTKSVGNTDYTTYPYAGHFDDPLTPTIDLNFGVVQEIYYPIQSMTNNNIYNIYHKKFIDEITDQDSRLLTAKFNLKPIDILRLDFRNKIFLDGFYYYINRVTDYNPTANDLTTVELLKIKAGVDFLPSSGVTNNKTVTFIGTGSIPFVSPFGLGVNTESGGAFAPQTQINGNQFNVQSQQQVLGRDNIISATAIGVLVLGSNNTVGDGSQSIALLNSSGCVIASGLQNVTLMNSSGVTVTESNVTYNNGIRQQNNTVLIAEPSALVSTNADTSEKDLKTYLLSANALSSNGSQIVVEVTGFTGINANNKTYKIYLGSTVVMTYTTNVSGGIVKLRSTITRKTATTLMSDSEIMISGSQTILYTNYSITETLANALTVKVTGTNGTASAGDVGVYNMTVKIFYK